MNCRTLLVISVFTLTLLGGMGCKRIAGTLLGDKVIAEVGDTKLYASQVQLNLAPGTTPEDSVKLLESYVDMWVKKQLKSQEAERRFSESVPDIDRMVAEYRNALLGVKLDSYYVDMKMDTTFTPQQIAQYYRENQADFILDRTIVHARLVKLPDSSRQRGKLKDLIYWKNDAQMQDFQNICQKYNFEFYDFSAWTDFDQVLSKLPAGRGGRSDEKILSDGGVQEIRDGDTWYVLLITEVRRSGDGMPLERAQDLIKKAIANSRRSEIIRSFEDSVYQAALANKQIVINVE